MNADQLTRMAIPAANALESHASKSKGEDSGHYTRDDGKDPLTFPWTQVRLRTWIGITEHTIAETKLVETAVTYVMDLWLHGTTRWLAITGIPGCGKTHVARKLHWWARQTQSDRLGQRGWSTCAEWVDWAEFVGAYADGARGRLDDLVQASHLVIDDLGRENVRLREASAQALHTILTKRERGKPARPTVVTSNSSVEELAKVYDAAIASRLLRNGREHRCEITKPHRVYGGAA